MRLALNFSCFAASFTVSYMGIPSITCPPFPGLVPAVILVPYEIMVCI